MLYNISEKPSKEWSMSKMDKALELFGEADDLGMPELAYLTDAEIADLVKTWVHNELRFYAHVNYKRWGVTFLVEGVDSFMKAMVSELGKHEIRCVYSIEKENDVLFLNFTQFNEK